MDLASSVLSTTGNLLLLKATVMRFIVFYLSKEGALGKPQPVYLAECTVQDAEGRIKPKIIQTDSVLLSWTRGQEDRKPFIPQ